MTATQAHQDASAVGPAVPSPLETGTAAVRTRWKPRVVQHEQVGRRRSGPVRGGPAPVALLRRLLRAPVPVPVPPRS